MFMLCQKCKAKPALTTCINGNLCMKCGQKCHSNFSHPTQFITHYDVGQAQTDRKFALNSLVSTMIEKKYPHRTKRSKQIIAKSQSMKNMQKREIKNRKSTEITIFSQKENVMKDMNKNRQSKQNKKNQCDCDSRVKQLERQLANKDNEIVRLKEKILKMKNQRTQDMKNYRQKVTLFRNVSKN